MKQTLSGLVAAIIVGAIGLIVLKSVGIVKLPELIPSLSPAPSSSVEPKFEIEPSTSPSPSPTTSASPSSSSAPTTKGGVVLGTSKPTASVAPKTTTKTTTTTITHKVFTLARVSKCPSEVTSELKNITSSLSIQYDIKDTYSAAITVWGDNGKELSSQTVYTGKGKIVDTGSNSYVKILIQPHACPAAEDNWMSVTASR